MGADCCGGGPPASAQQDQQSSEARLEPSVAASAPYKPARSDAEVVAEKQPYYAKRIELFEQFRQRNIEDLEKGKAANKPIEGLSPACPPAACMAESTNFLSFKSHCCCHAPSPDMSASSSSTEAPAVHDTRVLSARQSPWRMARPTKASAM